MLDRWAATAEAALARMADPATPMPAERRAVCQRLIAGYRRPGSAGAGSAAGADGATPAAPFTFELMPAVREALGELRRRVEAVGSPVVFCHHDLQPLNLMEVAG